MPGSLLKQRRIVRKRANNFVNNPQRTTPIKVTTAVPTGSVMTVQFDQAVALSGVPKYTTDIASATATAATQSSPTEINVTFSVSIAAATELRVPYEEPAVRNSSGGFVATSLFTI